MYIKPAELISITCLALARYVTPPGEPVGVLGTWTGAQCGWAPSPLATTIHPDTPYTPRSPQYPLMPLDPF